MIEHGIWKNFMTMMVTKIISQVKFIKVDLLDQTQEKVGTLKICIIRSPEYQSRRKHNEKIPVKYKCRKFCAKLATIPEFHYDVHNFSIRSSNKMVCERYFILKEFCISHPS